jgi:hypothetical protein
MNAENFKYVQIRVCSYSMNHAEAGSTRNPSPVYTLKAPKCMFRNGEVHKYLHSYNPIFPIKSLHNVICPTRCN